MYPILAVSLVLTAAVVSIEGQTRSTLANTWPRTNLGELQIDSSAPGLLPSGRYVLAIEVVDGRVVGSLRSAGRDYGKVQFTPRGCDDLKSPAWAQRATARGMPPATGTLDRRVEIRLAATNARNCVITGLVSPARDPLPGGRPNPGGPDQIPLVAPNPLADLAIRAVRRVPADPAKVEVQVVNIGAGPAAATQVKLFYNKDGKVTTAQSAVPPLNPKASAWIGVGVGMPIAAADSVGVRVDDPNGVPETNEGNNSYKVK